MRVRIASVGTPGGRLTSPDPERYACETAEIASVVSHVENRGGKWVLPGYAPGFAERLCDDCRSFFAGAEASTICFPCTVRDGLEALEKLKSGFYVRSKR
jgi:hypothetical protein